MRITSGSPFQTLYSGSFLLKSLTSKMPILDTLAIEALVGG
jgi:hypothetical protein